LPTLQEGNWTDIDDSDELAVFGDLVISWQPSSISDGCRVWQFDPDNANPLGNSPIRTSPLPDDFDANSRLFGVVPAIAETWAQQTTPGTINFMREKIEHIVYYMVESRSFDNVLGWLYKNGQQDGINWVGVNKDGFKGLDSSMSNPMPDGSIAHVSKYQDGKLSNDYVLGGPAQDPWHDNSDGLMQMFHGYNGYANKETPTMNGFAWNQNSSAVLSSFTPEQLSVMNGLAKNYAVSDDWFSSLPGGTDVNRAFTVSGSAYSRLGTWEGGSEYQDWPNSPHRQTIWNVLWNNGEQDWKIYYTILWQNAVFTYQLYVKGQISEVDAAWATAVLETSTGKLPNSKWISQMDQFYSDIKNDELPKFSYIEPVWVGDDCTSYHPGSTDSGLNSLIPSEVMVNDIYAALTENPEIWEKTLLVVTADKSGGLYDHVPPSYAKKPWPKDITDGFEFDIQGPRVPAIFASPWIKNNTVLRTSNGESFDATSFAATLLDWYGIPRETWGLGDRITSVPTIESVFTLNESRSSAPKLTVPYDKDYPKED